MNPSSVTGYSKWWTLAATCLGGLVLNMDLFIVNVALPAIGEHYHASFSSVSWTVAVYALMIGVFPGGLGRIGDLWGHKRLYMLGLIFFTAASFACGMAPHIGWLIVFRALQGIGAAALIPGTMSLLVAAFPKEQKGLAIGINSGIGGLGLIAGPVLSGLLVHGSNWKWIFWINVPIGVIAIALTAWFVQETKLLEASKKVDWLGLVLLCAGISAVLFSFTRAENAGFDGFSLLFIGAGLIILALFAWLERRISHPLIDFSLFKNMQFSVPLISMFLFSAALFGSQPYWSLFFQNYWGFTPLQGGLSFLPATVLIALFSPFAGIISQKVGSRLPWFMMLGVLLVAVSFLIMIGLRTDSHYEDSILPSMIIRGFGIPILFASTSLMIMSAVPDTKIGLASGLLNMFRNVGTAMGIALLGQLYTRSIGQYPARPLELPEGTWAELLAQARQFFLPDSPALQPLGAAVITHAFQQLALICTLFLVPALLSILFIRRKASARDQDDTAIVAKPKETQVL
ncbi:MFS transporter [Paenibacillus filicis]|uniref:MFS transporter n=1 Tax=Paenibacillus filicis TaxID=669464 RepID=A0ABU9DPD0_9BACL